MLENKDLFEGIGILIVYLVVTIGISFLSFIFGLYTAAFAESRQLIPNTKLSLILVTITFFITFILVKLTLFASIGISIGFLIVVFILGLYLKYILLLGIPFLIIVSYCTLIYFIQIGEINTFNDLIYAIQNGEISTSGGAKGFEGFTWAFITFVICIGSFFSVMAKDY